MQAHRVPVARDPPLESPDRRGEEVAPHVVASFLHVYRRASSRYGDLSGAFPPELVELQKDAKVGLSTWKAEMGTHGRTGIERALLGSVAERVIRHVPCSVLVSR